jgi:hypothetical protein
VAYQPRDIYCASHGTFAGGERGNAALM